MSKDSQLEMNELRESLLEDLPKVVVRRVNALKNIHTKYIEEYRKYQQEVRALERKYHTEVYEPLFTKRATIVNGSYEPTAEESKPADSANEPTNNPDGEAKGIPEFWLQVMQNNQFVAQSIFEHDEEALKFLTDVKCQNEELPKHGFTITFHFAENPFFTDSVLTKTYTLEEDETYGELILDKAEGSKINWKAGKNLTVKTVTKKEGGGKRGKGKAAKGAVRTVKVEEPQDSFFQFFSPPQINEEEEPGEEDELLEADFDVGCTFKDKLIPFAALWFTGEAAEFEDDFGDEFDEEDFDDEEGDEDDDEDDEDSEDDEPAPPKGGKKGGKGGPRNAPGHPFQAPGGAKGGPEQPQQPECKQQ